ncbi:MAG TPA: UbiA family prenyltransferase [Actinocrinis sp.]|nr:UbiA family prenyltransferase [Actinocrinis sp.]
MPLRPAGARVQPHQAWRCVEGYLLESRIPVQVVFTLRFATVAAVNGVARLPQAGFSALAWLLATSAMYVFNGLMDLPEDRANGSKRPIAAGVLSPRAARIGCYGAAAGSLLLALAVGELLLALLLLVHLGTGYAYSAPPISGKNRGSTASLLLLAAGLLTYAGGWVCSDRTHPVVTLVLALGMSCWMAAVGAVVKDLSDVVGDAAAGRRTPVLVLGDRVTRLLAAFNALLIAVVFAVAAGHGAPQLIPAAVALTLGALAVTWLLWATRGGGSRSVRRAPYRAFMVTQYAVHLGVILPGI